MDVSPWWISTLVVPVVAMVTYWWIARAQVRRTTEDLRAQLDAERRLTAHISHRLRNQLTVVFGFSETLVEASFRDGKEVEGVAAIVSAEALEASRLVEDLVAVHEIEDGDIIVRSVGFDPSDEIQRAVTPFQRLGSDIAVDVWSGTAVSDPLRFRKIVQNLLSNAVRHGGSEIAVIADISGSTFECTVADDGAGLPDDVERHHFGTSDGGTHDSSQHQPLADDESRDQTSAPIEPRLEDADPTDSSGMRLGLAVAIGLAQKLGGTLRYSRIDGVTELTVELPVAGWPEPLVPLHPPSLESEPSDDSDAHDQAAGAEAPPTAEPISAEDLVRFGPREPDAMDLETSGEDELGHVNEDRGHTEEVRTA